MTDRFARDARRRFALARSGASRAVWRAAGLVAWFAAGVALQLTGSPAFAQGGGAAPAASATTGQRGPGSTPLTLRGTLVRQTIAGEQRLPRELVTLHRVNAREAGPVDSVLTDPRGGFTFRVSAPDTQSMYLVSARYGGIAYFSQPAQPGQPAPLAEIVVFDTTSADIPLELQGRHLVLSSPNADGVRSVIDVLEVENDTVVTRVAGANNRPTFSLLLPGGARNVRASQGEQGAGAVEVRAGRAELFAPLAPGLRQVVLTYELPDDAFPLSVPLERGVAVLEVLLEEPGASADGGGLVSQGGVSVDGKAFTRYLGQNAPANAVLTLRGASAGGVGGTPPWLLPLVLTGVTLGAILVMARRGGAAAATVPPAMAQPGAASASGFVAPAPHAAQALAASASAGASDVDEARDVAQRIAAIDALLEGGAAHPASHAALADYRQTLKQSLIDLLADRTPVP